MRKGCFISVIVFLTLLLIGVFYLVKFHGEDLLNVGKEKMIELTQSKVLSDIESIEQNEYADSIRIVLSEYFKNIKNLEVDDGLNKIEEFTDNIDVILMDSRIDSIEFDFLTKRLLKYE